MLRKADGVIKHFEYSKREEKGDEQDITELNPRRPHIAAKAYERKAEKLERQESFV